MRTFITLFAGALLLVASVTPASAQIQNTGIGVKGGVNFANIDLDLPGFSVSPDWRTGLTAGVFSTYTIRDLIGLQAEVLLTQKGTKFNPFGDDNSIRLTYLEIPVLATFNVRADGNLIGHLNVGPSFAFRLKDEWEQGDIDILELFGVDSVTKAFDFGLAFGGGVTFDRWVFDFRYTLGLTDIADTDKFQLIDLVDVSAKNRSIALTVGYKFR